MTYKIHVTRLGKYLLRWDGNASMVPAVLLVWDPVLITEPYLKCFDKVSSLNTILTPEHLRTEPFQFHSCEKQEARSHATSAGLYPLCKPVSAPMFAFYVYVSADTRKLTNDIYDKSPMNWNNPNN